MGKRLYLTNRTYPSTELLNRNTYQKLLCQYNANGVE